MVSINVPVRPWSAIGWSAANLEKRTARWGRCATGGDQFAICSPPAGMPLNPRSPAGGHEPSAPVKPMIGEVGEMSHRPARRRILVARTGEKAIFNEHDCRNWNEDWRVARFALELVTDQHLTTRSLGHVRADRWTTRWGEALKYPLVSEGLQRMSAHGGAAGVRTTKSGIAPTALITVPAAMS